ncbi:MAG: hypothetical protein AMXMBFR23_24330 [Chloroflexota bacterium]
MTEQHEARPEGEADDAEHTSDGPVTAGELLRQALVDDDDPRFPRWLPLPGIIAAAAWAGWEASANGAGFLGTMAWPGAAIFALTTLAAWFGWQLEID